MAIEFTQISGAKSSGTSNNSILEWEQPINAYIGMSLGSLNETTEPLTEEMATEFKNNKYNIIISTVDFGETVSTLNCYLELGYEKNEDRTLQYIGNDSSGKKKIYFIVDTANLQVKYYLENSVNYRARYDGIIADLLQMLLTGTTSTSRSLTSEEITLFTNFKYNENINCIYAKDETNGGDTFIYRYTGIYSDDNTIYLQTSYSSLIFILCFNLNTNTIQFLSINIDEINTIPSIVTNMNNISSRVTALESGGGGSSSGGSSEQTSIMNLPRHSITISNPTSNNFEFDTPLTPDKEYIVSMSVTVMSNVYLNFTASVLYGLNITGNQYIVTPMFGELSGQWLSVTLFITNGTLSGKVCVETTNGDFNINTIQEFVNATGYTIGITFFENRDIGISNV